MREPASRGGWSTKLQPLTDARGNLVMLVILDGQCHECPQAQSLLETGMEELTLEAVVGDTDYSSGDQREWLEEQEIVAMIHRRCHETAEDAYEEALDFECYLVERAINRLKRFQSVATRDNKVTCSSLTTLTIACILERN